MSETYWIDSHAHMNDPRFRSDIAAYMTEAARSRVGRIMMVCCSFDDLDWTLGQADNYPFWDIAFGFHPEQAAEYSEADFDRLKTALASSRIKAVGEIGLDYYWTRQTAALQKELFIRQLQLANATGKPVLIHSRSASQDTYDILKEYAKTKIVMHCYSGSAEMMKEYEKLGCYISFGGPVTFKKAVEPRTNAKLVRADRLLIETDCPYMAPEPMRGRDNQSAYVRYVGEFIATLRAVSSDSLAQQLMNNYQTLLGK